ncbi:META domain-containing protein [Patescibacteria group bacterium]|nr:META domain-containing protein [Patescibacteria group bacterium]
MKKPLALSIGVGLLIGLGVWYWLTSHTVVQTAPPQAATDYKSIAYMIDGQSVALSNGRASTPAAPGSASRVVTEYFGNEATGDLNGDGIPDVAFIITQNSGGSGTFYYAVAAIKTATGYLGTDAVILGDRIAPQTTEIRDGKVIVNYADRNPGEPMTTRPSVGKTLVLKLDPATLQFGIVAPNFEGEADPSRMTLQMQTWTWVSTLYNNDTSITPRKASAFTLTFTKDPFAKNEGNFSATTDCNRVNGVYAISGNTIVLSKMLSTLMACDGSQEQDFTKSLAAVQSYHFTSKGELIFDLKFDSGTMTFR